MICPSSHIQLILPPGKLRDPIKLYAMLNSHIKWRMALLKYTRYLLVYPPLHQLSLEIFHAELWNSLAQLLS